MARPSIRNASDILRILNATIKDVKEKKIDNDTARLITYICNTASSVLKNNILEQRIEELEEQAEELQK